MWGKWDRLDDTWRPPTSASSSWRSGFLELAVGHSFLVSSRKKHCRCQFCAKTPGSQISAVSDFSSVYRKSLTCRSTHSVDLRLYTRALKVRQPSINSPAKSLHSGSGAITETKLMRWAAAKSANLSGYRVHDRAWVARMAAMSWIIRCNSICDHELGRDLKA
jgi:hypothetical protein